MSQEREDYILVVDDQPEVAELEATILEGDHNVVVCTHPQEAIEAAAQRGWRALRVIVTDLNMPDMNGLDLINTLRQIHCWLPALVVTASEEPIETENNGAVTRVLRKPFDCDQLVSTVDLLESCYIPAPE